MKHIINLLGLFLAFATIFYTSHYVEAGDVCRTIFGCTALIMWMLTPRREWRQ